MKDLTQTELKVLLLVSHDNTDKQVAEILCVSAETTMTHMKSIRKKLGCNTRAGAIAKAMRWNIIM